MDRLNETNNTKLIFIFDKIRVSDRIDAEEFFKNKALKSGYSCEKNNGEKGTPDFRVWRGGKEFYVEVKTNDDGLRIEQARWIKNNPKKKVVIYYLQQIYDSCPIVYNKKIKRRKEKDISNAEKDIRELMNKNLI